MLIKTLINAKLAKIFSSVNNFNFYIEELIRQSIFGKNGGFPVLAAVVQPGNLQPNKKEFSLKDILDNGIMWCPTPKKRTTAEKK
jgi:hypothetical protein